MTSYETIRIAIDGTTAIITIAREKALNALNRQLVNELTWALRDLEADARVRAIILTGAGEKAFVAGGDITEMKNLSPAEAGTFSALGHTLVDLIEQMGKPIIAAVNGFALGGGCELALACDFIYSAENAKFGLPEVNLGTIPGFGGTQRLPRRIGMQRALELTITGDIFSAQEAFRLGLVNLVCPATELMDRAKKTAQKIAQKGPTAVSYAKRLVRRAEVLPLSAGNELERELFALTFATADQKEGMTAFLEKRPAKFSSSS